MATTRTLCRLIEGPTLWRVETGDDEPERIGTVQRVAGEPAGTWDYLARCITGEDDDGDLIGSYPTLEGAALQVAIYHHVELPGISRPLHAVENPR